MLPTYLDLPPLCAFQEISIWADLEDSHEKDISQSQLNFHLDSTALFWEETSVFTAAARFPWIIGFTDPEFFDFSPNQIRPISERDFAKKCCKIFQLSGFEKCIILKSDVISLDEGRIMHPDNRMVYCSVKATLQIANQILRKFMLMIVITAFPKIRVIYSAFGHFDGSRLQVRRFFLKMNFIWVCQGFYLSPN